MLVKIFISVIGNITSTSHIFKLCLFRNEHKKKLIKFIYAARRCAEVTRSNRFIYQLGVGSLGHHSDRQGRIQGDAGDAAASHIDWMHFCNL